MDTVSTFTDLSYLFSCRNNQSNSTEVITKPSGTVPTKEQLADHNNLALITKNNSDLIKTIQT